ncbi:MAG: hypothetical protein H6908_04055 [Hyphomicrobiales bacterium]|nr:hypothetical protein [Rickettsiales bacterium]MCP5361797.1 hypothetical protein [Hyphomicrobiales bacterium]
MIVSIKRNYQQNQRLITHLFNSGFMAVHVLERGIFGEQSTLNPLLDVMAEQPGACYTGLNREGVFAVQGSGFPGLALSLLKRDVPFDTYNFFMPKGSPGLIINGADSNNVKMLAVSPYDMSSIVSVDNNQLSLTINIINPYQKLSFMAELMEMQQLNAIDNETKRVLVAQNISIDGFASFAASRDQVTREATKYMWKMFEEYPLQVKQIMAWNEVVAACRLSAVCGVFSNDVQIKGLTERQAVQDEAFIPYVSALALKQRLEDKYPQFFEGNALPIMYYGKLPDGKNELSEVAVTMDTITLAKELIKDMPHGEFQYLIGTALTPAEGVLPTKENLYSILDKAEKSLQQTRYR